MSKKLTQKRLKELLNYDSETGIFTWLIQKAHCIRIGQIAGGISNVHGYRQISIDNISHKASRLAWLYMEGYFPENQIDHIDRVRHNDKWNNLRHVSQQCNTRNSKMSIKNKSGITGVYWRKNAQKWRAEITILGNKINLGTFGSKLKAVIARWNAEVKYKYPNCNTTSTAYLYIQKHTIQEAV